MRLWFVAALSAAMSGAAHANVAACWWTGSDPGRPDLSCTPLTKAVLTSLEGATKDQVVAVMAAPGLPDAGAVLRFESNYAFGKRGYDGVVYFTFAPDGRVTVIDAFVEAPKNGQGMKFVWNAVLPGCSAFAGSTQRCDNIKAAPRPVQAAPPRRTTRSPGWLPGFLRRVFFFGV
ncbi:MAG: hypothetical protein HIU92_02630 [Proteobacteria bacterium]|nr:hypothetical protein [Pseudomonadota bacterium]